MAETAVLGARWRTAPVIALIVLAASGALADEPRPAGTAIYSCIDDKGKRITADRPIPECNAKEQRVLNRDGSLREVRPPTLTAEERAAVEARDRRAAELRLAQAEAVRRDRNLMARYRDEQAHEAARAAALESVKVAMKASEKRLADLAAERKPLLDEAEFYKGRQLPAKVRLQMDANEAAVDAQRSAMANQEAELVRVNRLFDIELDRLRRLWAGTPPGSMGPLSGGQGETRVLPAAMSGSTPR